MPLRSVLPQNCLRASSQPIASPNGSAQAVATTPMRSDSSTAVHSAGERPNMKPVTLRWPPMGPTRSGRPDDKLRGPRRAMAAALHPSRLAALAPQDDGSNAEHDGSRRRFYQKGEAVALENGFRSRGAQERQIQRRFGLG